MFVPFVPAGMEERDERVRGGVDGASIASFPKVASDASVGEVGRVRQASVLAAEDVIDLVGHVRVVFVDQAVLTPVVGALGHELPQACGDITRQAAYGLLREPWP